MIDISIVVPTLGSRIIELERLLTSLSGQKVNMEIIIVSQDNYEAVEGIIQLFDNLRIRHIHNNEKGLSKARNTALKICRGEIVTFSDDDCWYKENAISLILEHFRSNQEYKGIAFQIYDPLTQRYYKEYPDKVKKINFKDAFSKSSIELFFRLKFLQDNKIFFDEDFGLGAKYYSGEENVFINDILKRKGKIRYIPEAVVYHQVPSSSSRLNDNNFIGKGPMLKRMHGSSCGFILLMLLWIKKKGMLNTPVKTLNKTLSASFNYTKKGDQL
jgi:glycosyltransferase involved in cell wall biosynthesis